MNRLLFTALLALSAGVVRADIPDLPFSFKATAEKIEPLPEYMGPNNPADMDFPYCPVKIDGEFWIIYKNGYTNVVQRYKGTNLEDAARQPDGTATFPIRGGYILGGMWYDASTQTLYAPLHGEVVAYPGGGVRREVHLAASTDKGLTWKYVGAILTSPDALSIKHPVSDQSGLYWDGGDGDQVLYVDEKNRYAYLYTNHYYWPKLGARVASLMERRVARCSLDDKFAPGKWKKFYDGAWSEPGIGGMGSPVNASVVTYNTFLKKYVTFNLTGSLAVCDDLAKQDWSPSYFLGDLWGSGQWGIWPTDQGKSDISTSGQDFYVYNFWQKSAGRRFNCEINTGAVPAAAGFTPTIFSASFPVVQAQPANGYSYQPLLESDDSTWARRTRRVGCTSAELAYKGNWTDANSDEYYEGRAKKASDKGAEVSFTFHGHDVYWRAARSRESGKAEVYLDGKLQTTVDLFATGNGTPFAMGFMKRGLPDGSHTLRVVATGEKNPLSEGTSVRSMFFEYGADSYRASDDFTGVAGKNQWSNIERAGSTDNDLAYTEPYWGAADGCLIGFARMTCGDGDAARKWTAPHDGTVRIEGTPVVRGTQSGDLNVSVLKNDASAWTATLGSKVTTASCDINVPVKKGDALYFVVHSSAPPAGGGPNLEVLGDSAFLERDKRQGKPIKIGDKEYAHGLSFPKGNRVLVHLAKPALTLGGNCGIDANADPTITKVPFEVKVDGRTIFKSDATRANQGLSLDLSAATDFEIDAGAGFSMGDVGVRPLGTDDNLQLSTLPVQGPHDAAPGVDWDPVVTYVTK